MLMAYRVFFFLTPLLVSVLLLFFPSILALAGEAGVVELEDCCWASLGDCLSFSEDEGKSGPKSNWPPVPPYASSGWPWCCWCNPSITCMECTPRPESTLPPGDLCCSSAELSDGSVCPGKSAKIGSSNGVPSICCCISVNLFLFNQRINGQSRWLVIKAAANGRQLRVGTKARPGTALTRHWLVTLSVTYVNLYSAGEGRNEGNGAGTPMARLHGGRSVRLDAVIGCGVAACVAIPQRTSPATVTGWASVDVCCRKPQLRPNRPLSIYPIFSY